MVIALKFDAPGLKLVSYATIPVDPVWSEFQSLPRARRLHWEKSGRIMKEFRTRFWSHAYEWFEYLHNELQKREQILQAQ